MCYASALISEPQHWGSFVMGSARNTGGRSMGHLGWRESDAT